MATALLLILWLTASTSLWLAPALLMAVLVALNSRKRATLARAGTDLR